VDAAEQSMSSTLQETWCQYAQLSVLLNF